MKEEYHLYVSLAERWQYTPDQCDHLPLGYSRALPDILWSLEKARDRQAHAASRAAPAEPGARKRLGRTRRMATGSMAAPPGG